MDGVLVLGALVVLALLVLGGFQWHNCRNLRQLQNRQSGRPKPAASP